MRFFPLMFLTLNFMMAESYSPKVAAHRGASGYLPEHTLEAKVLAYAQNSDYIEQDVVMSKDNVLVILHDHTLETTTDVAEKFPDRKRADGSYYAIDFTLEELKSLRVTERFDPKTKEAVFKNRFPVDSGLPFRIPTLEEELKLIEGLNKSSGKKKGIYVEVKEPAFHESEGKDIMQATIDMLTKYGYNSKDSLAILQTFDYEANKKSRKQGWKGDLAMLVYEKGQNLKDDTQRHKWLLTPEGIADVAEFATIYAPWFSHLAKPNKDGYEITSVGKLAKKYKMKLHSWTHRVDSLPKGFKSSQEVLDVAFKKIKLDGLFSDFPDVVVDYLKQNKLR